jgi:pimeloyl-ACP methyl ester carboxylesterase
MILLHGLLGAAACWVPAMKELAREARVYAVDSLGMGYSERVRGLDVSLNAEAERLRAFMDSEGIEAADLCGSSHGGALAMFFAARYPGRVRSLILQAPANPFCVRSRPQIRLFSSRYGALLGALVTWAPRRLQAVFLRRMYGDPRRMEDAILDHYIRSMRVPGTVSYVRSILRGWTADMAELKGMLKRLRGIPTLLLWGEEDRAVSLDSGRALSRLLGWGLEVLPGIGHLPYEEAPREFASRVRQFLRGVREGSVAPRRMQNAR